MGKENECKRNWQVKIDKQNCNFNWNKTNCTHPKSKGVCISKEKCPLDLPKEVDNYIFGVLTSISYVLNHHKEGVVAKDIRQDLLADYSEEELKKVVSEIDPDLEIDWEQLK